MEVGAVVTGGDSEMGLLASSPGSSLCQQDDFGRIKKGMLIIGHPPQFFMNT